MQEAYRVWAQKQAQQLDDLNVLVGGSAQLLEAFSAVENAPQPNKQLKVNSQDQPEMPHVTCL